MAPSKKKQVFTEALISDIQSHRALWDKTCEDHKDAGVCANAWNDIKANLGSSHSEEALRDVNLHTLKGIKSHWKNLKDTYRTKKKEAKGKSGAGRDQVKNPKEWPYFEMLRFLDHADSYGKVGSSASHVDLAEGEQSIDEEEVAEDEEEEDDKEEDDKEEDDKEEDDNSDEDMILPAKRSRFSQLPSDAVSQEETQTAEQGTKILESLNFYALTVKV